MMRRTVIAVLVVQWCGGVTAIAQLPPPPPKSKQSSKPQPRLQVIVRRHDLGTLIEGDKVPVTWLIENRGDADLVITRTKSSCGCTVVRLADKDKTIPPGGRLELTAEFNTQNRRGDQRKNVKVFSNDPREPELTLSFKSTVAGVYNVDPSGIINLRTVVRGSVARREMTVTPAKGYKNVVIESVTFDTDMPLSYSVEPDPKKEGGKRILFSVSETAALGTIAGQVDMALSVDGVERTRTFPLRAEVVGNVTWLPKVLDASRQTLTDGRRLPSVTIRSAEKLAFEVRGATAGDRLDVTFEQLSRSPSRTAYSIYLTVREGAAPGPFATTLLVETDSMDQPVINIPVFGIIKEKLAADPSMAILRADGTAAGKRRRIRLMSVPGFRLEVTGVSCDNPAIAVSTDPSGTPRPGHIVMLTVELMDSGAQPGKATITVTTNVPGFERFEIPCRIEPTG